MIEARFFDKKKKLQKKKSVSLDSTTAIHNPFPRSASSHTVSTGFTHSKINFSQSFPQN
jgi:hypothetical protein